MIGREFVADTVGGYRFGFNGKEGDSEGLGGGQSTYDYGFRIYNPAIARFLSLDPLTITYPWLTPYQFAGNMPIAAIDIDGLENIVATKRMDKNNNPIITIVHINVSNPDDMRKAKLIVQITQPDGKIISKSQFEPFSTEAYFMGQKLYTYYLESSDGTEITSDGKKFKKVTNASFYDAIGEYSDLPYQQGNATLLPRWSSMSIKEFNGCQVYFETNRSDFTQKGLGKLNTLPKVIEQLDIIVEKMKNDPSLVVVLEGYTDQANDKKANMGLSSNRNTSIADYLKSKVIPADKIQSRSLGETKASKETKAEERTVKVRLFRIKT